MVDQYVETAKDRIQEGDILDGWTVTKQLPIKKRSAGETGSFFSRGYLVEDSDGRTGYLKAMDYETSLFLYKSFPPHEAMAQIANDISFEKTVASHCKSMNRVITAIDSGSLNPGDLDLTKRVEYIIFEKGERGGIREYLRLSSELDVIFILKALHNTCVGLNQLHQSGITHQDMKPSNVIIMGDDDKHVAKVADLGRVIVRDPEKFGIVRAPLHFNSPLMMPISMISALLPKPVVSVSSTRKSIMLIRIIHNVVSIQITAPFLVHDLFPAPAVSQGLTH